MEIELAINGKGDLLLISTYPLDGRVERVEYYRDQKLFMLAFDDEDLEPELMHYEVSEDVKPKVEHSPFIIIVISPQEDQEAYAYNVPLIQIGI